MDLSQRKRPNKARLTFIASGCVVLWCFYEMMVNNQAAWSDSPFRIIHWPMAVLCLVASVSFCWDTRGNPLTLDRFLGLTAVALSSLWLLFFTFIRFGLIPIFVVLIALCYMIAKSRQPEPSKKHSDHDVEDP